LIGCSALSSAALFFVLGGEGERKEKRVRQTRTDSDLGRTWGGRLEGGQGASGSAKEASLRKRSNKKIQKSAVIIVIVVAFK